MGIWLRRVCALGLISLGMALIFLPFNETRSGIVEKESVSLQKAELLNLDEIDTQFPGVEITDITGPELNPDDYPDLWRVFMDLGEDWTSDSGDLNEWKRFQNSVLKGISKARLVVFREGLVSATIGKDKKAGKDAPETALFSYLGRYNPNIKELTESDLTDYPAITRVVKRLDASGTGDIGSATISKNEWDRMVDRYLEPLVDSQTFNFKGTFYEPEFGWDAIKMEGRISGLRITLKVLGVISLLIGFLLLRRLYFRKAGIMVNPRGIAIFYDVITLLVAIPSAYMIINTVLSKTMYIPPIIDDDYMRLMGIFLFCAGIPILSLFTSRFTSQSVEIDSEGIHVDSLGEKCSIRWDSLDSMDFSDEYVLVFRLGIPIPRQLQKRLTLESKTGQRVIINEPQLKSIKRQIALRFEQHAPNHLRDEIKQLLATW